MANKIRKNIVTLIKTRSKAKKSSVPSISIGGHVDCLATADFVNAKTGEVYGRVWIVTGSPKVAKKHDCIPIPEFLQEKCFNSPLGVIVEESFQDVFMGAELKVLPDLLDAIRSRDPKKLQAINGDYAPFYCRQCRKCYSKSAWSTMAIFDEEFYDYTEAICPKGHTKKVLD